VVLVIGGNRAEFVDSEVLLHRGCTVVPGIVVQRDGRVSGVMPRRSNRRTALAALLGAVVVCGLAAVVSTQEPVGAQTTTSSTASTSTTTTQPTTTTTQPTTTTTQATTSTTEQQTTTTTFRTSTTFQQATSTSSSTSTSTSTTSTTAAPAVVAPPGYNDPSQKGPSFWSSGRKLVLVVGALLAMAIAMVVLNVLYWRHTRPGSVGPGGGTAGGSPLDPGPIGPVDPMLAAALRPESAPFVTRDDLGLA
jgi:hypothetical protein